MKKLINYNRAVFLTGNWFTKLWMISFPIFILFLIFGNGSITITVTDIEEVSTLWQQRTNSWPMIVFYSTMLIGYTFRNLYMVSRLINKYNSGDLGELVNLKASDYIVIEKAKDLMK